MYFNFTSRKRVILVSMLKTNKRELCKPKTVKDL